MLTLSDLDQIAILFDDYRQFYHQPTDVKAARAFIEDKIKNKTSLIFVYVEGKNILGFTQIYLSYCSVLVSPIYLLYDLYVVPEGRKKGIGNMLLKAVIDYAKNNDISRIDLATAKNNTTAQSLYKALGWRRDDNFDVYSLDLF